MSPSKPPSTPPGGGDEQDDEGMDPMRASGHVRVDHVLHQQVRHQQGIGALGS
jgi:hypothetical protein